jgi:hypothetical protein
VIIAVAIRTAMSVHSIGIDARWRHVDLERFIKKHDSGLREDGERGFISSDKPGEFMTRMEAAHHAVACGQVAREKINWNLGLFSEDLW